MGKPRSSPVPRIERKIIEKNRRTLLKNLYSNLISLLPDHTSKVQGLSLPDQIGEAVEYIKIMKNKLESLRQKKELLLQRKKRLSNATNNNRSSPVIEVHDMGPNLDVVLANGIQDFSTFHRIIRFIHHHGVDIPTATFTRDGNSTIQLHQDKVGQSKSDFEGATMSTKLKELVYGTCSSTVVEESELNLWDYEIESNIWGFDINPPILAPQTS